MTLRWKKEPAETGLLAVGVNSKKRSSKLHDGTTLYATVYANDYSYFNNGKPGWYWVAFGSVPYKNTCKELLATEQEAKAAAMAYVKQHLAKQSTS